MLRINRRQFLGTAGAIAAGVACGVRPSFATSQAPLGERPRQDVAASVLFPRDRVPLSFIIDDSTCLVNMGHFCMPQFATAWPERESYKRPWKTWPREIPDSFVRSFADFCIEHGVRGKYSVVPFPACVGWLDRELPGWSRAELLDSLKLVRDHIVPNFDIHPEMITHTRVIDLKTGRPIDEISAATMENSYPQSKKSVDEMAAYLAYALQILKKCDLPCEGITTPGGFGNQVKSELPLAAHDAVRDVYGAELPHYFKYVIGGTDSTQPKLEHVRDLASDSPRVTVNVPAGTGDWYGGWDGEEVPQGQRYSNDDATSGRMVELIERGEPALMLCHWPGLYSHGAGTGLEHFKRVVRALNSRFGDRTIWLKLSEIARYWAAKELTSIERSDRTTSLTAPFGTPMFTLRVKAAPNSTPTLTANRRNIELREVTSAPALQPGTWRRDNDGVVVCFDLPKGKTVLVC